jgi:hypothetical protein
MPEAKLQPGDAVIYQPLHGKGHGQNAKGVELSAEMAALDITPGTTGLYLGDDKDTKKMVFFQWADVNGTDRITSIEKNEFNKDFVKA